MSWFSTPGRLSPFHPPEPFWKRCVYGFLAIGLMLGFLWTVMAFWVPAHGGVDQNGYLFGGRMFAEHHSTGYWPRYPGPSGGSQVNPFAMVGNMWVGADLGTDAERYYPKYPIGLPMIVAALLKLGGTTRGVVWAYYISPVGMALGIGATFLAIRLVAGSFAGLIGALIVAASPTTLALATNPNSHGASLFFVAWGMFLLLSWWKTSSEWKALAAGLLLGYAVTIRYTDGLLILPLLLVLLFNMRWRQWRSYFQAGLLLLGWAIPVVILVAFNLKAMGAFTGYGPTNESTGFRWKFFQQNWETMVVQLGITGMFLFFPLALAGLAAMFARSWRMALVLSSWIIPTILVYTAYYWAPDNNNVSYMRFFVTVFPALAMAAMWLLTQLHFPIDQETPSPSRRRWSDMVSPLGAGVLAAIAVVFGLRGGLTMLAFDFGPRLLMAQSSDQVIAKVPQRSLLFCSDRNIAHHLQFVGDYEIYTPEVFTVMEIDRLKRELDKRQSDQEAIDKKRAELANCADPNQRRVLADELDDMEDTRIVDSDPQGLDPQRRKAMYDRLKSFTPATLNAEKEKIILQALQAGRRVFVLIGGGPRGGGLFGRRAVLANNMVNPNPRLDVVPVDTWTTDLALAADDFKELQRQRSRSFKPRGLRPNFWVVAGTLPPAISWRLMEVVAKPPPPPPPRPIRPAGVPRPIPPRRPLAPTTAPATQRISIPPPTATLPATQPTPSLL